MILAWRHQCEHHVKRLRYGGEYSSFFPVGRKTLSNFRRGGDYLVTGW
jgi:hypothetical protein